MKPPPTVTAVLAIASVIPSHGAANPGCHGVAPEEQTCSFSFTARRDVRAIILRSPAVGGTAAAAITMDGGRAVCSSAAEPDIVCVFAGGPEPHEGEFVEGMVAAAGSGRFSIAFVYET